MTALVLMLALTPQDPPAPGLSKGRAFPDFLLPDVDGGFGRLSNYRGKKLVVFNFASW
jgi:hypothetical protein